MASFYLAYFFSFFALAPLRFLKLIKCSLHWVIFSLWDECTLFHGLSQSLSLSPLQGSTRTFFFQEAHVRRSTLTHFLWSACTPKLKNVRLHLYFSIENTSLLMLWKYEHCTLFPTVAGGWGYTKYNNTIKAVAIRASRTRPSVTSTLSCHGPASLPCNIGEKNGPQPKTNATKQNVELKYYLKRKKKSITKESKGKAEVGRMGQTLSKGQLCYSEPNARKGPFPNLWENKGIFHKYASLLWPI